MGFVGRVVASGVGWLGVMRMLHVVTPQFGGENPLGTAPDPENWHHEGITRKAADSAGWSTAAGRALAFHADYLDSYLYNPLWWFDVTTGGGADRLATVLATQHELVKLHFDDLFSPEQVRGTWQRYLSGTVAGLLWVAHSNHPTRLKVSMAHNVVGASLHAVQDFFTHSNWIDEADRRDRSWFDVPERERRRLSLWTGSYEEEDHLGIKPHGDFLYACTVINNLGSFGRGLLRLACHAASPMSGASICQTLRSCDEAEAIEVPEAWRDVVPEALRDELVWVKPGINVDSRWLAEIGARERGVRGLDGETAFTTAYGLAVRASCQWLQGLAAMLQTSDLAGFWSDVTSTGVSESQYKADTAPWESMALLPYQFLSAGPYPPERGGDDAEQWYLRLTITTADVEHAGTDADIVPTVDGRTYPTLDHAPPAQPPEPGERPRTSVVDSVLSWDDFERGSTAAYVVGPLPTRPGRVVLRNDAPDLGDVLLAAAEALLDVIVGVLEGIRDFFLGLIGYQADFVDSDHVVLDAATLDSLPIGGEHTFSFDCNGRSEGRYRIDGAVSKTGLTGVTGDGVPWREYLVGVSKLHCREESDWDRGTSSDEPFVVGLVIPHGGTDEMVRWRTGPFSDVDSGDTRTINRFWTVRVPEAFGMISLAVAVYESDSESSSDRDDLLDEFADQVEEARLPAEDGFLVTLGESLAEGWRPSRIEAVAFRRGETAEVVWYDALVPGRWVDGGEELDWTLRESRSKRVHVEVQPSKTCPEVGEGKGRFLPDLTRVEFDLPLRPDLIPRPTFDVNLVDALLPDEDASGDDDEDVESRGGARRKKEPRRPGTNLRLERRRPKRPDDEAF